MSSSQTKQFNSATCVSAARLVCLVLVATMCLVQAAGAMQLVEQVDAAQAAGQQRQSAATLALVENPELVARVLESLLRSIVYSASSLDYQAIQNGAQKRGLDLGISRGFSGSQAGKHLMGLSAASFANGPGRR